MRVWIWLITGIINGDEEEPLGGADPAQIVSKALLCFNDKYVSFIPLLNTYDIFIYIGKRCIFNTQIVTEQL